MKAEDALKAHQAAMTGNLGAYWKSRMHLLTDAYQHPLTNKEYGQLKQLHKYLGPETKPVIAFAIEHWWKFASRAGNAAGTSWPADPNIGFLLKHHQVAVNLLEKPSSVQPVVPVVAEPVQLSAAVEPEPIHVLSPQELAVLLEGLKAP